MNKAELIRRTFEHMLANDIRKPVVIPKQSFTITDDDGHSKVFSVKRKDKDMHYTMDDIRKVLTVAVEMIIDAVSRGEEVSVTRLGVISAKYRAEHKVRIPGSMKWRTIPGHYIPRISFSKAMKDAARVYEAFLVDIGEDIVPETPKYSGRGRPTKDQKPKRTINELMDAEEARRNAPIAELLEDPDDFFDEPDEFDEDEDFGMDDDCEDDRDSENDAQEDIIIDGDVETEPSGVSDDGD